MIYNRLEQRQREIEVRRNEKIQEIIRKAEDLTYTFDAKQCAKLLEIKKDELNDLVKGYKIPALRLSRKKIIFSRPLTIEWLRRGKFIPKIVAPKLYSLSDEDRKFRKHLRGRISSAIWYRLRRRDTCKHGKTWEEIVGYTVEELMIHLEKQFWPGMSWCNYGKWHVDHIIPDSAFNYTSIHDPEFKECWALSNLQPLWDRDNFSKNAKLDWDKER